MEESGLTRRGRAQWRGRARSNPAPNEPRNSATLSCRASKAAPLRLPEFGPCQWMQFHARLIFFGIKMCPKGFFTRQSLPRAW